MSKLDVALVQALLAEQFPDWAGLSIRPVDQDGWDNRSFRLGADMSVRLPSAVAYADQVAKEAEWLPHFAQHLPLPIPQVLAVGRPGAGYPFPWSVRGWIKGQTASDARILDPIGLARDLGGFLKALHRVPIETSHLPPLPSSPTGGEGALRALVHPLKEPVKAPPSPLWGGMGWGAGAPHQGPAPGAHNFMRGGDLAVYDQGAREGLAQIKDRFDLGQGLALWERALASHWQGPPLWVHGDLAWGNLLLNDQGCLTAVIDFGCCAVGDPACDLVAAWRTFNAPARRALQETVGLDADTWHRARGWALWKSAITLAERPDDVESLRAMTALLAGQ